jgi:hypothetical protein
MNKFFLLIASAWMLSCSALKGQSDCYGNKTVAAQTFADSTSDLKRQFDSVALMFLGIYEDTVIVYYNHKEVYRFAAYKDNYPASSSDYTGHTFNLGSLLGQSLLVIKLVNQGVCTSVPIDKSFPLITVQRYGDKFFINKRNGIILK